MNPLRIAVEEVAPVTPREGADSVRPQSLDIVIGEERLLRILGEECKAQVTVAIPQGEKVVGPVVPERT